MGWYFMSAYNRCPSCAAFILFAAALPGAAEMKLALNSSIPWSAPLGTVVTWTPDVQGTNGQMLWYRYRVRRLGDDFHMIRDFGPQASLDWTTTDSEGIYEIEATVRDNTTGDLAVTSALFQMSPVAPPYMPVVSRTSNPLVMLYSAPPCPEGASMRVLFWGPDGNIQATPAKSCLANRTMNFYLAGMRPETQYTVQHVVDNGNSQDSGPAIVTTSGYAPRDLTAYNVMRWPADPMCSGVLLQSTLFIPTMATDLSGNIIWYYGGQLSVLTRPEPGGRFLGIYENPKADTSHQVVREFDLAGNTLLETNAARVNEQLAAMNKRQISGFHHDAVRLPDGNIMVLAAVEQILTDVQGPGPVDVIGDMIVVLNNDLQVVWTWDAFDHLDPHRLATLNETCQQGGPGCPPFYLAQKANDWLHGNSLHPTPDGNILYSTRHQDWVIKIDYNNGAGSGDIIWKLGKDGDFTYASDDPYPWFSHQHDATMDVSDPSRIAVFDDGNLRWAADPTSNSRGQVIELDEQNRIARLVINADMGAYSYALGSARRLPNGHYHFNIGWIQGNPSNAQSVEVDESGNIVYDLQVGTPEYRSFRMSSLYAP